jgi:DNA excision repair protein ERCC-6
MFIRGKPIRFGYKLWMLCSSDGYPYQAIIYCGKADRPEHLGLGEHVVTTLASCISDKTQHELFFDNFFTSHSLLLHLKADGLKATGTIRDGRLGGACFSDKRAFRKMTRGSYEHACDGKVNIVRWSDNNLVTCASNFDHVLPAKLVQRHVAGHSDKVQVPQPLMIANYITGMGGVDLMDRLLSAYRPRIKGKKWWWSLFVNSVNNAVVAAWKLHCRVTPSSDTLSHLNFRREVVLGLMKGASRQRLGGPTASVPHCVRYDGFEHYLSSTTQGRCASCGSNTRKMCGKCGKRLHTNCFTLYHTQ